MAPHMQYESAEITDEHFFPVHFAASRLHTPQTANLEVSSGRNTPRDPAYPIQFRFSVLHANGAEVRRRAASRPRLR